MGNDTVAVIAATPTAIRNNDVEHDYRQDSDLFYLTGFDEPESVLVLAPRARVREGSGDEARDVDAHYVLFVRPRDPEREVWDGDRAGIEGAKARFGADVAYPIDELDRRLPDLLAGHDAVLYRFGSEFDPRLFGAIARARRTVGRRGLAVPTRIIDPVEKLHELRLRKDPADLARMRRACAITAEAHIAAMAKGKPGSFEYELDGLLLETFRKRGAERPAYGSIVGSGPNATVLHYRRNDRRIENGDLVLIDAGCEFEYLASDVTRTFPASGKFSEVQRKVYEVVLEAQLAAIAKVKPGATQADVHDEAVRVLTKGLVELGVLSGDVGQLVAKEAYKPWYMHKTGHWLGMDVHDVGAYFVRTEPDARQLAHRPLEPGMVITIEPGLYFGVHAKDTPEHLRGIGVRIEDDILVTPEGYENLTATIPKTVAEVEAACAR